MNTLRASVRPVLTYAFACALIYGATQGMDPTALSALLTVNLVTLGAWFGERAIRNARKGGPTDAD